MGAMAMNELDQNIIEFDDGFRGPRDYRGIRKTKLKFKSVVSPHMLVHVFNNIPLRSFFPLCTGAPVNITAYHTIFLFRFDIKVTSRRNTEERLTFLRTLTNK